MWQSTDEESSLKDAFLTDFAISFDCDPFLTTGVCCLVFVRADRYSEQYLQLKKERCRASALLDFQKRHVGRRDDDGVKSLGND
jgi:hypothetical protein